jgi:hypothetical protein
MVRSWRPANGSVRRGARARGHQGRGKRSGPGGDDAWEGKPAGGGAIGGGRAAAGRSTAGGRRAEQGPTCARRKKRGERSGGLVCDFQKNVGTSR